MSNPILNDELDELLAIQFMVAWAGEGLSEPRRLDWWSTDLVDEAGGGDFFARLLPKTHRWTALETVRKAAIQADALARSRMASPDDVRTLFFWGFDLNERLGEQLARHKHGGEDPIDVLPFSVDLYAPFDAQAFTEAIRIPGKEQKYKITPAGRELTGKLPDSPALQSRHLAAALIPFGDQYPAPFFRIPDRER